MSTQSFAAALLLAGALASPSIANAQHQQHQAKLGTVHFPTSCSAPAAERFDRATSFLHSFEFGAAIRGYEEVLKADSACAMAWWGIAVSRWTNPMVANIRPAPLLARGLEAVDAARKAADAPANAGRITARERDYIAAIAELYTDPAARGQPVRLRAYEAAMAALAAKYPDDGEARIFHAISLVAAAPPTDKTYANQLKAGATLEEMFARNPDHPGLAHYIIHAYDVPALAGRAAQAASRYADIAPSAAHALHMPSHTFTRVGTWDASVRTNLRSMETAKRDGGAAEELHAMDYAVYANLQMRREEAARALIALVPEIRARFDPNAVVGAAPGSAGVFALAAIPARWALERRAWNEAAALVPAVSAFPYTEGLTYFARALGAARTRDLPVVRAAVDSLNAIQPRLVAAREAYWAEQVAIQALGASAWLEFAEGRSDSALGKMRAAATREDATEKAAVTPGPLAPARELLGDMLMELKRPAEALVEYRATLTREPNRYWTLMGAQRAAAASGDRAAATRYEGEIRALTKP